jgi:hypothetical protein
LEHAPADAHDEVHLFFDSTAETLAAENQARESTEVAETGRRTTF